MSDSFSGRSSSQTSPAVDAAAIIPSDGQDLPEPTRAIYVGSGGTLGVQMVSGATVDLTGALSGAIYPLRVRRVLATGTSATDLLALR